MGHTTATSTAVAAATAPGGGESQLDRPPDKRERRTRLSRSKSLRPASRKGWSSCCCVSKGMPEVEGPLPWCWCAARCWSRPLGPGAAAVDGVSPSSIAARCCWLLGVAVAAGVMWLCVVVWRGGVKSSVVADREHDRRRQPLGLDKHRTRSRCLLKIRYEELLAVLRWPGGGGSLCRCSSSRRHNSNKHVCGGSHARRSLDLWAVLLCGPTPATTTASPPAQPTPHKQPCTPPPRQAARDPSHAGITAVAAAPPDLSFTSGL